MAPRHYLFTSESVTEGHPDKLADQISDGVLDAVLGQDAEGRVACETLTATGLVVVAGEVTTTAVLDTPAIVRGVLREVGYTDARYGIDSESCAVLTALNKQSSDIAQGVGTNPAEIGAGDQGLMFGYATDETPESMPLPITLAHRLCRRLARVRKSGTLPWLRPDGKSQVTIEFDEQRKPVRAEGIVIAAQHAPEIEIATVREKIREHVIRPVIQEYVDNDALPATFLDDRTHYFINQTGRFVIGGPHGDSGLTGRKIIVDTYGGSAPHGGGAFSGKDPTKVDRSASYAARWAAKNVVAAGFANRCQIQLAYSIGYKRPINVSVETFGTGAVPDSRIEEVIRAVFDFSPGRIIHDLNLRRPIYRQTAAYGHFGRLDIDLPWEKLDRVEELRKSLTERERAQLKA